MSPNHPAIRVSHLGKKYTIGGPQEKYRTFRDAIVNSAKAPFKRLSSSEPPQEFWALKDVSFDVEPGEVVGIIGRNGAGKSTLLKILSRITSPTEGTVDLYGRVGSLLEVGTGFHPELTGRENIFLSGSILGMKKREIDAKLDDIVKFSEIEKFLDTPVKRYSSGMYVRLAFAVAAHMDTEILLIDEVLAVGDAAFQKKCLGKMGDVATKEGRTVLFVSHNMGAVQNLCSTGIVLENGICIYKDEIENAVKNYMEKSFPKNCWHNLDAFHHYGSQRVKFKKIEIKNIKKKSLSSGSSIIFYLTLGTDDKINSSHINIGIGINNILNERLATLLTKFDPEYLNNNFIIENDTVVACYVDNFPLISNIYKITLYVDINGELSDHIVNEVMLEIPERDVYGTGNLPSQSQGPVIINHHWRKEKMNNVI